ncbi:Tetracenomycin polyketide synthesis O-methyltransferase TcmP [Diaporthe amygdali]|uniref:Tetracenomycin polyketide synthesis O-methyltransferase TcmP n=1 Tax=Phomopsis amygdali TaxID=1214568 RepID=UPI0022FEBB07|nr:Tetracenomycin polyketide synthesis O-methyltransferase TcmP [Diaporthe amygdali]KAJ0125286.1 Tetracenomycin polyketide synthesis O-methyltransferase TcmP [Diaporthe amygdali]
MASSDVNSSRPNGAATSSYSTANGTVINLIGGFETLLWTLLARATDAVSLNPILDDHHALKTISRVKDTGFKFRSSALGSIWAFLTRVVSVRSRSIDMITEDFLKAHPKNAIILHLASALDSRSMRVKWQGEGKLWVDVDQEDVVELRKQLIDPVNPGEGEYRLTGPNEYSEGWLTDLKIPGDRPVLIIMEGLSMYLSEAENIANFKQLTQHFQYGGEIVFDVLGSFPVWAVNSVLPLFAIASLE